MEEFAADRGGRFPQPQHCRSAHHFEAPQVARAEGTAVALAGDALHSFPPDLGLGVNAALQDVDALVSSLERNKGDFKGAVEEYSKERLP